METVKVSSKGQVVLPKRIRSALGWVAGTELSVEESGGGVFLRPIRTVVPTTLAEVVGCTGYSGPRLTLEDMERAIRRGAKRARR